MGNPKHIRKIAGNKISGLQNIRALRLCCQLERSLLENFPPVKSYHRIQALPIDENNISITYLTELESDVKTSQTHLDLVVSNQTNSCHVRSMRVAETQERGEYEKALYETVKLFCRETGYELHDESLEKVK